MDLEPSSFQTLKNEIEGYVRGPLESWAERIEAEGKAGLELWEDLRKRGYLRLAAPQAYGGYGLLFSEYLQLMELFSMSHASVRMIVHVVNGIWRSLDFAASEEQRQRFVVPQVKGDIIVAFTLTEPTAGTGADIRAHARRDGAHYVLTGEKHLITFADVADYFLTACRLDGSQGSEGTLALMIPKDAPGLTVVPMGHSMGVRGTGHGHLYFDACRVPVANRLGAEGDGLRVALEGFLVPSRISVAMSCVGLARRALELAVAHAKRRSTFNKTLAERQAIQFMLAEAATELEAARELVLYAARTFESGQPAQHLSAMAKLFASEMLQHVTDKALQIHGGVGYFQGPMERIYRDARAPRFEEGTAEIQKAVIARWVLS